LLADVDCGPSPSTFVVNMIRGVRWTRVSSLNAGDGVCVGDQLTYVVQQRTADKFPDSGAIY